MIGPPLWHHCEKLLALRNQMRLRVHVYEIKAPSLPKIGSGDTVEEAVLPLPPLPPPPLPHPVRPAHPAPTSEAVQFDLEHMRMTSDMAKELVVLVSEGRFEARRPVRVDKAKAPRPAAAAAGKRAREPKAGELALVGAEF